MKQENGFDASRVWHGDGMTAICGRVLVVSVAFSVAAACDSGDSCVETRTCTPAGNRDTRDATAGGAPTTGAGGETTNGAGGNAPVAAGGVGGAALGAGGGAGAGGKNTGTIADSGTGGAVPDGGGGHDGTDASSGMDAGSGTDAGSSGAVTDGAAPDGDSASSVCDPAKSPRSAPCSVDEQYGVFASPNGSDATGDGSRSHPVATLTKAIAMAHTAGKRVYACATQGPFREAVTIDANLDGVAAYGRFDCGTWAYSSATSASVVSPASVALTIRNVVHGIHLEDFSFQAASGASAGDSSIAAFVVQSQNVTLKGVTLTAGSGVAGTNGAGITAAAGAGPDGPDGGDGCGNFYGSPAEAAPTVCGGVTTASKGGHGGYGADQLSPPTEGQRGAPMLLSGGAGGVQQTAPWVFCTSGAPGTPGTTQPAAKGGASGSLGASGYKPSAGGDGLDGTIGQGGGGGGGRLASACDTGAAGGTGGSGGCGGHGGTGGKGGGASIALASITSTVSLDHCVLSAHSGGTGGRGGSGQPGGKGGSGGQGGFNDLARSDSSCAGNVGGKGGDGGTGGGGAGGPSVGVASVGTAPSQINTTIQVATSPAPGGADGNGGTTGTGAGTPGLVANAHAF